ncbi:MAG: hypothetical protein NWE92_06365 [Candidatus Bathyarchaeota archaeon]|nr:hypothetical protein [Candidatus Bathyarchaeota archaeon]
MLIKIAAATYIYFSLNIGIDGTFWADPTRVYNWPQNQALIQYTTGPVRWPLTFLGWDSAWYLSIMTNGYAVSNQSYAFSPGLPFFANSLNLVFLSPTVSLVIVTLLFGVLWIPLYQLFAEKYVSKAGALLSVLLLAFSPYLFVFTTVAYTEGLFLFFVLVSWVLLQRGHSVGASFIAALAPLMRIMGILMIAPLLYNALKSPVHRLRNVFLSFLPLVSLLAWFASFALSTGDMLATFHTTEWSQLYSVRTLIFEGFPQYGVNAFSYGVYPSAPVLTDWLFPYGIVVSFAIPLLMLVLLWKKDKALWLYAALGYLGIAAFGAIASAPRFFSVLFPLWIPLAALLSENKKSLIATAILSGLFLVVAVEFWLSFLSGEFVA